MSLLEGYFIPNERLDCHPSIIRDAQSALLGKTVANVGYVYVGGEAYPCIKFTDGTSIVANCDDEGNGPGVLEIGYTVNGRSAFLGLCEVRIKS